MVSPCSEPQPISPRLNRGFIRFVFAEPGATGDTCAWRSSSLSYKNFYYSFLVFSFRVALITVREDQAMFAWLPGGPYAVREDQPADGRDFPWPHFQSTRRTTMRIL